MASYKLLACHLCGLRLDNGFSLKAAGTKEKLDKLRLHHNFKKLCFHRDHHESAKR
jgi:hypothetical protein